MKKGRNTAEILVGDDDLDDIELSESGHKERILILKAAPPSRRVQLMAHGVKEIRCTQCDQIRPLAGANDSEKGWVCKDCSMETVQGPKEGMRKGKSFH